MSLADKKAALAAAQAALDAARKAAEANKEDDKLAAAVQEAASKVSTAQGEYVTALETADPLSQNIEERLAKVRKEEKEKLYATQEKLKQEKEAAEKKAKELEDKLKQQDDDNKKRTDKKDDKKDDDKDADAKLADLEKRMTEAQAKVEQEAAASRLESNEKIASLQKELAQKEIENYRTQKLAAAGNTVVPELVSGATKEEIDNSIIRAQQAKARIVKEVEAARTGVENETRTKVPTTLNPQGTLSQLTGAITADQIRKMSPSEWAAQRKTLGFK